MYDVDKKQKKVASETFTQMKPCNFKNQIIFSSKQDLASVFWSYVMRTWSYISICYDLTETLGLHGTCHNECKIYYTNYQYFGRKLS